MQVFRASEARLLTLGAITISKWGGRGRGGEGIHEKCYYWMCFMGVGAELVNEIHAAPPPPPGENVFTLLDHVVKG